MTSHHSQDAILDLVGLGFGPANIAIAGVLTEQWAAEKDGNHFPVKKALFIEKCASFRWHPGMLLPDAKMQISFMKDLATLRNPRSPYTFLSYLHSQGRLVSFINRGSTIPSRKEYSDYLAWASSKVQANGVKVLFGHEIIAISAGTENTVAIHYRDPARGEEFVVRAKNIIISPGGEPKVPSVVAPIANHPLAVHSSAYATSISKILDAVSRTPRPLRIAVIGSGQSAAEVAIDLRNRLNSIPSTRNSRHQVDMLIRKGSLKPSDDSPFTNEIFDPASTDAHFSTSSRKLREMKLAEYKSTNYGVISPRTLEDLYEIMYNQRLDAGITHRLGDQGARDALIDIKPYTFISEIKVESKWDVTASANLSFMTRSTVDTGKPVFLIKTQNTVDFTTKEQSYDAIVYATGYERRSWVDLIKHSDIAVHFGLDSLTSEVRLLPCVEVSHASVMPKVSKANPSKSDTSAHTTPASTRISRLTSSEMGPLSSQGRKRRQCEEVFISRNYRLLPTDLVDGKADYFVPGIYLQGCEESTHGMSDTLLSVMGVRAGEVVRDLVEHHQICNHRRFTRLYKM